MWVVGALILLVVGAVLIALIGWAPRRRESPPIWDISGLSGTYTGIIGILAGFSVGSAFAAAVGMLLVSFLILIGSAMM